MTDETAPEEAQKPDQHKGRGCFLSGLTFVLAVITAVVISGLIAFETSDPSPTGLKLRGGIFAVVPPLLLIGLPAAVAIFWRKVPGFLLGMGLTIALLVVLPTGCGILLSLLG